MRLLVLACYPIRPHFQLSFLQFLLFSSRQGVNQAHVYDDIRNNYVKSISVVGVLINALLKGWVFYGALKVFELIGDKSKIV